MKLLQYLGRGKRVRWKTGKDLRAPEIVGLKKPHFLFWDLATTPPTLLAHSMGGLLVDMGAVPPMRTMMIEQFGEMRIYAWRTKEVVNNGEDILILRPQLIEGMGGEI